ncbi:MAG: hypothetical protein PHS95_02090 [Candidatus Pacebacteria bacterium]|nr:hypothetical protein [Candidatus Paceibacterota bacterium]
MHSGPSKEESITAIGKIVFGKIPAGCFVCGKKNSPTHWTFVAVAIDISSRICEWFPQIRNQQCFYIPYEGLGPNKIEVKIGSCNAHLRNLKKLRKLSLAENKIAVVHVREAQKLKARHPYWKKPFTVEEELPFTLLPAGNLAVA